jgi:hypothetical protein
MPTLRLITGNNFQPVLTGFSFEPEIYFKAFMQLREIATAGLTPASPGLLQGILRFKLRRPWQWTESNRHIFRVVSAIRFTIKLHCHLIF